MTSVAVLDQRGQLLRAAVGFAGCSMLSYDRALWALRTWLDSWSGVGRVAVGMHRRGYDLQLMQYDDRDVLHDWDGALARERDRHRLGAHARGGSAGDVGCVVPASRTSPRPRFSTPRPGAPVLLGS